MGEYSHSLEASFDGDAFISLVGTAVAYRQFGADRCWVFNKSAAADGEGVFQMAGVGAAGHEVGLSF